MSLGFAPYLSRLFVPRLVWKSCTNIRICLRFKAIVGCQCRTSCQSWKVCRKQDSLQFPKGVFKNVFVLVVVGTIVYSACTTDPDIAWCSDWPLHINCLSSETQVEKSLENSRITGNGARIFAKAKKLTEKGNLSAAEELYQQLIQEEPTFAPAYGNLANIQARMNRVVFNKL